MPRIPSPSTSDSDDVVWALQTAAAQWDRGEQRDAAVWLQRAARGAGEHGDDDRAMELGRLAAELLDALARPETVPEESAAAADHDVDLSAAIEVAVGLDTIDAEALPPPHDEEVVTSAPPIVELDRIGKGHDERLENFRSARSFVGVRDAKPFIDEIEREASAPARPKRGRPPPPPFAARRPPPSASTLSGESDTDGIEVVVAAEEPSPINTVVAAETLEPDPESLEPLSLEPLSLEPLSLEPLSLEPLSLEPSLQRTADEPQCLSGPTPSPPSTKSDAPPSDVVQDAGLAMAVPDPSWESRAPVSSDPASGVSGESTPAQLDVPAKGDVQLSGTDVPSVRPASESVSAPPPALVDLSSYEAFADVPEEDLAMFQAHAEIQRVARDEEVSGFGLALVVDGEFNVAAMVSDATAAHLGPSSVLRTRGSVQGAVEVRLVCSTGRALVATWAEPVVDDAFRALPWVAEDLQTRADRVHALVGATLGPLGNELDSGLFAQLVPHMAVRVLMASERLLGEGDEIPGLIVVGVGALEVLADEAPARRVPGDFLFPSAMLEDGLAPSPVQAGPEGAVLLQVDRATTQELFMTFPPLLDLLLRL